MSERTGPPPDLAEGRRLLAEAKAEGPAWDITLRRDAIEHWLYGNADALLDAADALAGARAEVGRLREQVAAAWGRMEGDGQ